MPFAEEFDSELNKALHKLNETLPVPVPVVADAGANPTLPGGDTAENAEDKDLRKPTRPPPPRPVGARWRAGSATAGGVVWED